MSLHSIQSNSTEHALIQWTVIVPQFESPLKTKLYAVLYISGNLGSKLINEISHRGYCFGYISGNIFLQIVDKIKEIIFKNKTE